MGRKCVKTLLSLHIHNRIITIFRLLLRVYALMSFLDSFPIILSDRGPAIVSCLNDSSLHSSLRQPAFDLIQTIVVSDAAALVTSVLNSSVPKRVGTNVYIELDDNEDNNLPFPQDIDETDGSSWNEFDAQNKIISGEYRGWMCIPMLWVDVLVDISPLILPASFSKAVFWARSRLCLVEPENGGEMVLDVKAWLSSSVTEISTALAWKVPTGSDDGGREESKNSVKVSTMCLPLIRTFKRFLAFLSLLDLSSYTSSTFVLWPQLYSRVSLLLLLWTLRRS